MNATAKRYFAQIDWEGIPSCMQPQTQAEVDAWSIDARMAEAADEAWLSDDIAPLSLAEVP